jgi:hypothetical protein
MNINLKMGNRTFAEWQKEKGKEIANKQKAKSLRNGINARFRDAQNLRKKVYRRAIARMISRMANPLLTNYFGQYVQKSRQRICIHTSIGSKVIMQRNKRFERNPSTGDSCGGFFRCVNKSDKFQSESDIEKEFNEVSAVMEYLFPEREQKKIDSNTLPMDLPSSKLISFHHVKLEKIKLSIQPLGEKEIKRDLLSYKPILNQETKAIGKELKPIWKKFNECLKIQDSKSLPSAKDFKFINPNGSPKETKVRILNQLPSRQAP